MLLTEEEAKTKWCPFARDDKGNRLAYGGDALTTALALCAAFCRAKAEVPHEA